MVLKKKRTRSRIHSILFSNLKTIMRMDTGKKIMIVIFVSALLYGIFVCYQVFATYRNFYLKHNSGTNFDNIPEKHTTLENVQTRNQVNYSETVQDQSGRDLPVQSQEPGYNQGTNIGLDIGNTNIKPWQAVEDRGIAPLLGDMSDVGLTQGQGQEKSLSVGNQDQAVGSIKENAKTKLSLSDEGLDALDSIKRPPGIHKIYQCHPTTHINFSKIHRCASTTLGNIILTFAFVHDLKVATPKITRTTDVGEDNMVTYDVMTQYGVKKDDLVRRIMGSDVTSMGVIREPLSQFVSSFHFHRGKFQAQLQSSNVFKEFISRYQFIKSVQQIPPGLKRNNMAVELGFREEDSDDEVAIQGFMERMKSMFDFVVLAEYFDEGVVLMKRMLCWDFKDIVFESRLTATYSYDDLIDKELVEMHKNWSSVNYKVYEMFQQRFVQHVQAQGQDFFEEVKMFKKINSELSSYCRECSYSLIPHPPTKPLFHADATAWSMEMSLPCPFCWIMRNSRKLYES